MKVLEFFLLTKENGLSEYSWKKMLAIVFLLIIAIFGFIHSCSNRMGMGHPVYRIARDGTWSGMQLLEKEKNLSAFAGDLLFAIAKKKDVQFELVQIDPSNLFDGLERGHYDGILTGTFPSAGKSDRYDVSNSFYLIGPVLVVKATSPATSLKDLQGKIIGIQTGSSVVFNVEHYPDILITSYDSPLQALSNLDKNIIDGAILGVVSAHTYTNNLYAGRLRVATKPLTDEGLRLITRNTVRGGELITTFDAGLAELKADGTYDTLLKKWGLINPEAVVSPQSK